MHIFNNTLDKRQVISNIPICHISMKSFTTPTGHAQCATVTNFSLFTPAHSNTPDLRSFIRLPCFQAILLSKESLGTQLLVSTDKVKAEPQLLMHSIVSPTVNEFIDKQPCVF